IIDAPVPVAQAFRGIEDALVLARDAVTERADGRARATAAAARFSDAISSMSAVMSEPPVGVITAAERLRRLGSIRPRLVQPARAVAAERSAGDAAEILAWAEATCATVESHRRDLDALQPWLAIPDSLVAVLPRDFPDETRAIHELGATPGLPRLASAAG